MKVIIFLVIFQTKNCLQKGCHDLLIEERVVHPPAEEDCSNCHELVGEHPFKKIEDVFELCTTCHDDKQSAQHPPVQEDCTTCHNPHSSPLSGLLKEKPPYLCSTCHEDIIKGPVSIHIPVKEGRCKECHDVHGNETNFFLLKEGNDLCFKCHTEMGTKFATAKFKHPPVHDCMNCHNPHSSGFDKLFNAMYPRGSYTFFTQLQYELCFNCHDIESLFSLESGFKKNGKNLHEVHVKRDKGRICTFCHNPHFSNNPKFVEGGRLFGPNNYILKIDFKKKNGGGICGPACHGKVEY